MKVTNISALRANIKNYIESVIADHEAVIINRGNTGAVLISLDEYNSVMATEKIFADQSVISKLNNASQEGTIEVDIDSL